MLKVRTVAIPIETMARWFFILFFINGYDLLTGYTCTRAH